ncbi:MAG: tyrosyl-tRNA synthetase [Actinomycetota bacterium]
MVVAQDFVKEFGARGLIHDSTDRAALTARATQSSLGVYVGFDPTADSLHIGHLLGQITLRRLQLLGHRPFTLAGGATGMVGDPSGRSEERNLLDAETLHHNVQSIKRQLERMYKNLLQSVTVLSKLDVERRRYVRWPIYDEQLAKVQQELQELQSWLMFATLLDEKPKE